MILDPLTAADLTVLAARVDRIEEAFADVQQSTFHTRGCRPDRSTCPKLAVGSRIRSALDLGHPVDVTTSPAGALIRVELCTGVHLKVGPGGSVWVTFPNPGGGT